jgi:hypothetical protein
MAMIESSWGNYNYKMWDSTGLLKYLLRETDLFNGVANVLETRLNQDSCDSNQITHSAFLYVIDNVRVILLIKTKSTSLAKLFAGSKCFVDYKYDGLIQKLLGY